VQSNEWIPWRIPLSEFTGVELPGIEIPGSINLRQVTSMSIGIGNPSDNGGLVGGLINDDCVNAIPLSGNVRDHQFDTTDCQGDGPEHCMHSPNIWYCYTATRTCNVTVSLCGSSYDTKLAVYDGCGCYPRFSDLIECNDDACGFQSEITFAASAGNKYLIEVGGWADTEWGPGVLNISCEGESIQKININDPENPDDTVEGIVNVDPVITVGKNFVVLRGTVTNRITRRTVENPDFTFTPIDYQEWIAPDGSYVVFMLEANFYRVTITADHYRKILNRLVPCDNWDNVEDFEMDPLP